MTERLKELIKELPICADGQRKVRALVEEITGKDLKESEPRPGQIYSREMGEGVEYRILVNTKVEPRKWHLIDMATGLNGMTIIAGDVPHAYTLVAESLNDFYEKGLRV